MLQDLAEDYPVIRSTFAEASSVLGFDLWTLVQSGPDSQLNATINTQPAMLTADIAVWRAWEGAGGRLPALVAGHSLGEYAALVCAGAISFEQALGLVAARARCMQEAVPEGAGAMAAILGLDDEKVREVCDQAGQGEVVEPANFNAPGQVVIAGVTGAVNRAVELARERGAKRAVLLPVSVPAHCACMRIAAETFAGRLDAVPFSNAEIPVVQNVDARARTNGEEIKQALLQQLYSPVYWVDCVKTLRAAGIGTVLECGPGKILTALVRRIDRGLEGAALGGTSLLRDALTGEAG
jgi:[acyl-carrier-protein] S-malonyltransferase